MYMAAVLAVALQTSPVLKRAPGWHAATIRQPRSNKRLILLAVNEHIYNAAHLSLQAKVQQEACKPMAQHSGAKHAVCKECHGTEARVPTAAVKDGAVPSLHTTRHTALNKKRIRLHTAATVHKQLSKRDQVALAESLSGRVICKAFKNPITRKRQQYLGKLEFIGACTRAVLLQVTYEGCTAEDITVAEAAALRALRCHSIVARMSFCSSYLSSGACATAMCCGKLCSC
jgi:hypothetical protein